MMCHIIWMLAILTLPLFWVLDFSVALSVYVGVCALTGVVFYLTIRSVRQPPRSGIEGMRGEVAEVVEAIRGRGRVRYHNALWYAAARRPIEVGEQVRIVGNRGLCLRVEKLTDEAPEIVDVAPHGAPGAPFTERR